jgi:hypothetical protein
VFLVDWFRSESEPDDGKTIRRNFATIVNAHLIHILVMAPREVHVIKSTVGSVDAVLGIVLRIVVVGVLLQKFGINNLI